MMQRTVGSGFPILLESSHVSRSTLVAAVQRVVGPALLYTKDGREKNEATSAEMENWVMKWRRKEERIVLVTDVEISRGLRALVWQTGSLCTSILTDRIPRLCCKGVRPLFPTMVISQLAK